MHASPDRHRAFLRVPVLLLALFMVPVVVLASPPVASAVESKAYGAFSPVTGASSRYIEAAENFGFLQAECSFSARYMVTISDQVVQARDGLCEGFTDSLGDGNSYTLTMTGTTSTGAPCSGSGSGVFSTDQTWNLGKKASFSVDVHFEPVMGPQVAPGCSVQAFALVATDETWLGQSVIEVSGSANLGTMPTVTGDVEPAPVPSSCEHFDPTSVRVWTDNPKAYPAYTGAAPPAANSQVLHFEVRGVRKTAPARVKVYALMAKSAGGEEWVGWQPENPFAAGDGWESWSSISLAGYWSRVIGVHVMSSPYDAQIDGAQDALAHKREISYAPASASFNGYRYDNDPTNCLWWFGEKRHVAEAGSLDEPHASVLPAPSPTTVTGPGAEADPTGTAREDDPRDSCDFSWTDPTTWASGGICATVAMLTRIWETLKGVPGAILDGLSGLFVPVDAPSWSDVPSPLKAGWVPSFDSLAAGGCAPLVMPRLSFEGLGGLDGVGPTQLLDTCNEPWPLVRTFTFNGLLALVLVGAIWKAFHAAAAALGMNVSNDGGDTDDH